jgi:hypothetical protein
VKPGDEIVHHRIRRWFQLTGSNETNRYPFPLGGIWIGAVGSPFLHRVQLPL